MREKGRAIEILFFGQSMNLLWILESVLFKLGPKESLDYPEPMKSVSIMVISLRVWGSETTHLRVDPPFSCISLDGNIFSSFFSQRKIDEESNTSGFIFFEALLN